MQIQKNKFISSNSVESTKTDYSSTSSQIYEPRQALDWNVQTFTPLHNKELTRCIYKQKDAKQHFDSLSTNYEEMYLRLGYPDPMKISEHASKLFPQIKERQEIKILDLGCGTGLVGKYLNEQGFTQIHGVDLSSGMLEKAYEKQIYQTLTEHSLNNPDDFPQKWKNRFDVVTCSGLINNNYMDYRLFEEMLLSIRKGGYAIFAARFSFIGEYWYDEEINLMEKEGRWKLLETESFFKYDKIEDSVGRFSKTPCKVFVYQKTQDELNIFKLKKIEQKE